MQVQSLACQPIRPTYHLNTRPAFGGFDFDDEVCCGDTYGEYEVPSIRESNKGLNIEREEYEELAKNKDSKFLSSIGTLGLGVAAAAASFYTFKTMAPKGVNTIKTVCSTVASWGFVKKSSAFVKKHALKAVNKVKKIYAGIKPETKLGKVKQFITDKIGFVATKVKTWFNAFTTKYNLDKEFAKKAANNTGATLVAIPAAITAVNSSLEDTKKGGENNDD